MIKWEKEEGGKEEEGKEKDEKEEQENNKDNIISSDNNYNWAVYKRLT